MKTSAPSFVVVVLAIGLAAAAAPPALVNYQGVLRNASDIPLTGAYDMVFHFYSAEAAGDEILVDSHTLAAGGQVVVSGGLFNVSLGGGSVTDGTGPGTYTSLANVFSDYGAVWLSIRVGTETLTPRVRIVSAGYALNAANLNGQPAGNYLDTSATEQTKSGPLTVSSSLASSRGVTGVGTMAACSSACTAPSGCRRSSSARCWAGSTRDSRFTASKPSRRTTSRAPSAWRAI